MSQINSTLKSEIIKIVENAEAYGLLFAEDGSLFSVTLATLDIFSRNELLEIHRLSKQLHRNAKRPHIGSEAVLHEGGD